MQATVPSLSAMMVAILDHSKDRPWLFDQVMRIYELGGGNTGWIYEKTRELYKAAFGPGVNPSPREPGSDDGWAGWPS